ncbi:MAG: arsenate reductase (azurin) small subunit, partial [Alphaproteobacteria bacterium]|nr:arsenate reductase (azurin) small subunit [Alphaproteobacteria bacterium]
MTMHKQAQKGAGKCQMTRRRFLLNSGISTATVMVVMNAGTALAQKVPAMVATYPRKKIAKLSKLEQDQPVEFAYPDEGA